MVNNAALIEGNNPTGAEKINNIDNIENNRTQKALFIFIDKKSSHLYLRSWHTSVEQQKKG
ncbi:MAG: hypothetical protein ACJ72U_05430 [Nitrososphaeraceae archaeon]